MSVSLPAPEEPTGRSVQDTDHSAGGVSSLRGELGKKGEDSARRGVGPGRWWCKQAGTLQRRGSGWGEEGQVRGWGPRSLVTV